jgi:hypothetical protein
LIQKDEDEKKRKVFFKINTQETIDYDETVIKKSWGRVAKALLKPPQCQHHSKPERPMVPFRDWRISW